MATIAETWIKAGGSIDGLHELMVIARRNCPHGRAFATSTMAVQSCGCPIHTYVRSEPGLYRLAHTERNRDAAYDRLAAAGAELLTTEMVLFEWLRTAEHEHFKEVQALIK